MEMMKAQLTWLAVEKSALADWQHNTGKRDEMMITNRSLLDTSCMLITVASGRVQARQYGTRKQSGVLRGPLQARPTALQKERAK